MFNCSYTAAICQSLFFLFIYTDTVLSIYSYIWRCEASRKQVSSPYHFRYNSYKQSFPHQLLFFLSWHEEDKNWTFSSGSKVGKFMGQLKLKALTLSEVFIHKCKASFSGKLPTLSTSYLPPYFSHIPCYMLYLEIHSFQIIKEGIWLIKRSFRDINHLRDVLPLLTLAVVQLRVETGSVWERKEVIHGQFLPKFRFNLN